MDASRKGISLGLGAEYQLSDRLSVFAEYSHTKFSKGSSTFDYGAGSHLPSWTYDFTHKLNEVQLGMNIRF